MIRTRAKYIHTPIKLIVLDSDTQDHPPSTANSTSENAVEFLLTTAASNATKTKDSSLPPARHPCSAPPSRGVSTFLLIVGGIRSSSSTKMSVLGCWSVFAPAPPPQRPSGGSGGWGDLWPVLLSGRWQKNLKVVVSYELEKEYKQSARYSYSKIAEIKTRK